MTIAHQPPAPPNSTSQPADQVVQRWRDLRELLIRQLDMFEHGGLTLHSNNADVSPSAIADLKANILEFDALILQETERATKT